MTATYQDFEKLDIRVGRIIEVRDFPEARKPALKLVIDFGPRIGTRNSSAQITDNYDREKLMDRLVVAVVNFPAKQIGPFMSECLTLGFTDESGGIVLAQPASAVPLGSKLH